MPRTTHTVLLATVLLLAGANVLAEGALMEPDSLKEQAPAAYDVKFETSKGDFVLEVHRDWAPNGADRFYNLVKNGYYDENRFFRVVPDFVVQWGMNGDPAITKAWRDARFKDDPVVESNGAGYITFAKTNAPNSRTTQVFINLRDNRRLDEMGFSPFGKIRSGMEVIQALFAGYGDAPRGPDQGRIAQQGNEYLNASFPKLDFIKKATIVEVAAEEAAGD